MIKAGLDMAGYAVLEAANLDEAVRWLEHHPVDVIVAALDLPNKGSSALLAALRRRPEWVGIPVLALADLPIRRGLQPRARPASGIAWQDATRNSCLNRWLESSRRADAFDAELVCAREER